MYEECPICSCQMFRNADGDWMCCLCGYTTPFKLPVSDYERVEHMKVLTDPFDETPIPKKLYLESGDGRIERLIRGSDIIEEIMLDDRVTTIAPYAFSRFKKLKKVIFSKNLLVIGEGAFLECRALEEIILPKGLLKIDHYAFAKCALDGHKLYVPEGVWLGRDALPAPYHKKGFCNGTIV